MDHENLSAPTGTLINAAEPSDLDVAIRVGQRMLTVYLAVDRGDVDALNQAYGGVSEALYILLRALGIEPVDETEAVRRSVDARFPTVAAFLADERGGQ